MAKATISPEKWQELLYVTIETLIRMEDGYDVETTAVEAGLNEAETVAFKAWVDQIGDDIEEVENSGTLLLSTERFLEMIKGDPRYGQEPSPEVKKLFDGVTRNRNADKKEE